jgi:translation initiation factor IF-3
VRLIDENGTQVGVISLEQAQQFAEERDLDLVEVAPSASPPVCRLMDYGKFRYEQSKKEREARKHQKQTELKEVRLRPKTDEHDLSVKAKRARRFLQGGDKVKFTVRFRGREMAHTNIGREILDQIIEQLQDVAIVERKPQIESRSMSLVVAPNAKTMKAVHQAMQEQSRRRRAEKDARLQTQAEDEPVPESDEDDESDADDFDEDEDDFDEDDENDEDDEDTFDEDDSDFDEDENNESDTERERARERDQRKKR